MTPLIASNVHFLSGHSTEDLRSKHLISSIQTILIVEKMGLNVDKLAFAPVTDQLMGGLEAVRGQIAVPPS